jgi:hypothetical protein
MDSLFTVHLVCLKSNKMVNVSEENCSGEGRGVVTIGSKQMNASRCIEG